VEVREGGLADVVTVGVSEPEKRNSKQAATYRLLLSLVYCLRWKDTAWNPHKFLIDVQLPARQSVRRRLVSEAPTASHVTTVIM